MKSASATYSAAVAFGVRALALAGFGLQTVFVEDFVPPDPGVYPFAVPVPGPDGPDKPGWVPRRQHPLHGLLEHEDRQHSDGGGGPETAR